MKLFQRLALFVQRFAQLNTGWTDRRRVRGTTLHLRIRDNKTWIEEDWTEEGISKDLVEAGIPEDDIVLAFQSPEPRMLSEVVLNVQFYLPRSSELSKQS